MMKKISPPKGFTSPATLAEVTPNTPIAVALSGGADSVALLHMLKNAECAPVCAVHVHHGIRGAEADRDAAFCRSLCESLDVPFTLICLDVPSLADTTGESLETAARNARYEALKRFALENDITLIATAHHADDQLETMLQNLLRGAGLRGLCGIPPVRTLGKAAVVRPLLRTSKEELLDYCKQADLSFVCDSTNEEPFCTRNRLRLDVIPVLRELWPKGAQSAARCAASLCEDEAFLQSLADDFLAKEGDSPRCEALSALPTPVFARVIYALLPTPPEATHVDALATLVREARPHASLSLKGVTAKIENGRLTLGKPKGCFSPYEIVLQKGITPFPCGVAILLGENEDFDPTPYTHYPFSATVRFHAAAANGNLVIRPRHEGERILSGGHHKLVRKQPSLSPYPLDVRERMPLLCDEEGVLAVPGGLLRDGANKSPDTTLVLFFE